MSNFTIQHNEIAAFTADTLLVNGQPLPLFAAGTVFDFKDNAPPPPPQGRLTSAQVTWHTHDSFVQQTDLTQFKNVAGVIAAHQTPIDWPYVSGATYSFGVPANEYVALAINVPPAGMPVTVHSVKNPNYCGSCPMDFSLSASPGDFNPATALRVVLNQPVDDQPVFYFRNSPGTAFYIGLNPGSTYYLNVRPHDGTTLKTIAIASQ